MNAKLLIGQQSYWFGDIYVQTGSATIAYDGTNLPLTLDSGQCYSSVNNMLFQTGIDFKVTGIQATIGWSTNTYALSMIWPQSSYTNVYEDLGTLTVNPPYIPPNPDE